MWCFSNVQEHICVSVNQTTPKSLDAIISTVPNILLGSVERREDANELAAAEQGTCSNSSINYL